MVWNAPGSRLVRSHRSNPALSQGGSNSKVLNTKNTVRWDDKISYIASSKE